MRKTSKWRALAAALAAGTLFQVVQTGGCAQIGGELVLQSLNFCTILNCEGSTFFNFCDPIVLLLDCL